MNISQTAKHIEALVQSGHPIDLELIGECSSKIFDQRLKLAFGYTLFFTLDLSSTTTLMQ